MVNRLSPTVSTPISFMGHMARLCIAFALMLGLATSAHAQNESLSAFVDRNDISVNDILTLTIRVGALLGDEPPSLNALNQDFDRLGTTISSSYTSINGNVQEWREYRVTLKPKNTGRLVIPSFRKGSQETQPITINVGEAEELTGASNNDIFLRTSVSKNSVYVQEQLIYTIKLYVSVRLDQGAQLSHPQVENAVVQILGSDQTYQEIVEGIRYDVTERKFVVFPQNSGDMTIPPIQFSASVGGRGGLNRLLSRNSPARQIDLASEAHVIRVKGIPDSFDGTTWLPARSLTIKEEWSEDATELDVGESITRNLRLRAAGLSSSLLPALEYDPVPGLRFYPDQPSRQDMADANGVIGQRAEGTAIVPAEAGEFTLPELKVPWWNTETDRMEVAVVPSRKILVVGELPAGVQPAPALPQSNAGVATEQITYVTETNPVNSLWIGTTALFTLAWLASTFLWLRSRQAVSDLKLMGSAQFPAPIRKGLDDLDKLPKPENSLRFLHQACENNDLPNIRRWSLSWGQAFFRNRGIKTLEQLQSLCQSQIITRQFYTLERALYGNTADQSDLDSKALLREIIAINKKGIDKDGDDAVNTSLPPLYKN